MVLMLDLQRLKRGLGFGLAVCLAVLASQAARAETKPAEAAKEPRIIRIGTDPWCPFVCDENQAKGQGLMIEFLNEILSQDGYEVRIQSLPWTRALADARAGKIDGVAGAIASEAKGLSLPESTPFAQRACFFAKDDDWRFEGESSLQRLTSIGAVTGYSYGEPLDRFLSRRNRGSTRIEMISGVNALNTLARKVSAGRNQVLVEDESVFQWHQGQGEPHFQLRQVGCLASIPLFIAPSPKTANGHFLHRALNRYPVEVQREKIQRIKIRYKLGQ